MRYPSPSWKSTPAAFTSFSNADVRNQRSQATGQVVASGSFGAVVTASLFSWE